MIRQIGKKFPFLASILLTAILMIPWAASADISPNRVMTVAEPVLIEKSAQPINPAVRSYLNNYDSEKALIWLFLTDKGVFNKGQFDAKANSVNLSDKIKARRAKMGLNQVTFADLPVNQAYIKQIESAGAKIRRQSRWLNAVSVETTLDKIDELAQLSFVASIKPIFVYSTGPYELTSVDPSVDKKSNSKKSESSLDYGTSFGQLDEIGVPPVHAKGYNGAGVTLAILDTGYRKTHAAFAQHYLDGRVLDEYDFINNDAETSNEPANGDWTSQWNHGTTVWSMAAGYKDGDIYGPAYGANFLLAKTEDVRSERPIEEDNWVAAMEWCDSLGADVISTSLGYLEWDLGTGTNYTYADMDGATATTSIAASTAASLGIVIAKSMGNEGPSIGSLTAPADAFDIISVGAVTSGNFIAGFSSRGPTFDGRPKPEVVARGVSTFGANTTGDDTYSSGNGTSFSTPLVGGAAAVLIQARPDLSPLEIRQALMETADKADNPDSDTYGHGRINLLSALGWGVQFSPDVTTGEAPLAVNFTNESSLSADSWIWDFGDGDSAFTEHASHTYTTAGVYPVALTLVSGTDSITQEKLDFIFAIGDTLIFETDSAYAGHSFEVSVSLSNSQPLQQAIVPFKFGPSPTITLDSAKRGDRTDYFEAFLKIDGSNATGRWTYLTQADNGFGAPSLPPGTGEIMKLYCTIDSTALGELSNTLDTAIGNFSPQLTTDFMQYNPESNVAILSTRYVLRGDANQNGFANVADLTYLVAYLFGIPAGPPPVTIQGGDVNKSGMINITDVTYLVDWLFGNPTGPEPPQP